MGRRKAQTEVTESYSHLFHFLLKPTSKFVATITSVPRLFYFPIFSFSFSKFELFFFFPHQTPLSLYNSCFL